MGFAAFILLVSLANFAVGFVLAVHCGHGPAWAELPQILHSNDGKGRATSAATKAKPKAKPH